MKRDRKLLRKKKKNNKLVDIFFEFKKMQDKAGVEMIRANMQKYKESKNEQKIILHRITFEEFWNAYKNFDGVHIAPFRDD